MKEKLLVFLIILGIILIVILIYSRFFGTKGLFIKEYSIKSSQLPTHFSGLKVVHLSDIHYGSIIADEKMKKVVEQVNNLNPDIIVLTGDLIERDLDQDEQQNLIKHLTKLNASLGKYAILGNHDHPFHYWETIIENSNFVNLNNQTELIYRQKEMPIIIHGMSTNLSAKESISEKLTSFYQTIENKPDLENTFKILLMHEPDFVDKFNHNDFNLILAGHSHKGQVYLPLIGPIFLPQGAKKYYMEHYKLDETDLFISSGIGNSMLNLRLFNRPSFNFYRIIN